MKLDLQIVVVESTGDGNNLHFTKSYLAKGVNAAQKQGFFEEIGEKNTDLLKF